jgi:Predicted carbamoyl transferase, NodU family
MKIQNIPKLQASFVPLACNDAGISLGAALYFKNLNLHSSEISDQKPLNPSLGPAFSDREILELIDSYSLNYEIEKNIPKRTANEISNGTIVGWFQGSAELGPRSLGNRSVLADPRDVKNKAKINQLLKKRDWFMPYAPSVLEEYMEDYFLKPKTSPYMATAFIVREDKKAEIPAAIHVDGSCRPNSVNCEMNKIYYETHRRVQENYGSTDDFNTSFNRHGIPTIFKTQASL